MSGLGNRYNTLEGGSRSVRAESRNDTELLGDFVEFGLVAVANSGVFGKGENQLIKLLRTSNSLMEALTIACSAEGGKVKLVPTESLLLADVGSDELVEELRCPGA